MKKFRDKLNKKGFTLVELIVVIVIILILAAALVPNVMRYIAQARESAFQSEAASYLVELQGYEAENFGKKDENIDIDDFTDGTYVLSGYEKKVGTISDANLNIDPTKADNSAPDVVKVDEDSDITIVVGVHDGAVVWFGYSNDFYFVNWEQGQGWDKEIGKCAK